MYKVIVNGSMVLHRGTCEHRATKVLNELTIAYPKAIVELLKD